MNKQITSKTVIEEFSEIIRNDRKKTKINQLTSVLVLLLLIVVFSTFAKGFFSISNFIAILNQLAIPLILATGATFVIITGAIDLSVEGLMGLSGIIAAFFVLNNKNANNFGLFVFLITGALGFLVGVISGLIQVRSKIPSFLLTFAISNIVTGIGMFIYKGIPYQIKDQNFLSVADISFLGIPVLMWIALAVLLFAYILQEYTAFGRYIYAIGSNESIPKSTGINVNKIKVLVFGFSGFCIAIAGTLGAARLEWGDQLLSADTLFPTITAVVLGGTSLAGGKGGVINTMIGAIIVAVLKNGLILIGVPPVVITGVQGLIIVIAVAFSIKRDKREVNK